MVKKFIHGAYGQKIHPRQRKVLTGGDLEKTFLFPLVHVCLQSQKDRVAIVAALDLTQSVAGAGPDRQTDFQKNVQAIGELLSQAPPASHIVILGITDRSFTQPYILLSARVPDDPGDFGESLLD